MYILYALITALIFIITWIIYLHYFVYGECKSKRRLDGKTVLITGGNSGIGFETAKDLAKRGARVIITSENYKDCIRAKNDLISITNNKEIVAKYLNLSSLENVRNFAEEILKTEEKLDILINNAGTLGFGGKSSKDGLVLGLQINYLGPFLLTHLLIDLMKKSAPSKIINVASTASQFYRINKDNIILRSNTKTDLSEAKVYSLSKLYVVFMTWEMADRLKQNDVTVNCVHPGMVYTRIYKKSTYWESTGGKIFYYCLKLFMKTAKQGAQTTIHCAVSEEGENETGKYFQDCKIFRPFIKKNHELINEVWEKSIETVKLQQNEIKM